MALRLVNTAPGESNDAVKPGQFAYMGLKSETLKVPLSTALVAMGLTNVGHHNLLPDSDPTLTSIGATVALETSERRRPITGTTSHVISSNNLVFTKNNTANAELGIYEVKMPISPGASCLAYFKFRTKTGWTPFAADWCTLSNMTGMYFGLEHGTYNTAAYAFLRANTGSGSLVVGGPLQAYNTVRPGQVEILPSSPHAATPGFAWRSQPDNSIVEIYLYFNTQGYKTAPLPGVPTGVPLVEVWTKIPANTAPVVQAYLSVTSFGQFPSSLTSPAFTNSRPGPSDTATIFFGNIAQTGGSDVLEIDDWAFFPDFRVAVAEGEERPNHNMIAVPDVPVEFRASDNHLPYELPTGRWFPDAGVAPEPSLFFQPGRRENALYVALPKTATGLSSIHRTEPRFEQRQDGIMIEAFISGEVTSPEGDGTGLGFSVEDGLSLYQVMMVKGPTRMFYGLVKDLTQLDDAAAGYYAPSVDSDFTSLKMVRLLVDRRRPAAIGGGKAQLMIDEEVVLTTDLSSDTYPAASSGTGRVHVGSLGLPNAIGQANVAILNYLSRYLAWEGVDGLTPVNAGLDSSVKFTTQSSGSGSIAMDGDDAVFAKTTAGGSSHFFASNNQSFGEVDGLLVDFMMKVDTYADLVGNVFASKSPTGVTFTVFLGNKRVEVGFYDCGSHGRMVAILPSSGDVNDIINQTDIGQPLSAPLDWTKMNQFRLIVKGHDRIDLIIGSPISPPAISLKWRNETDGFDLPVDVSTPRLAFGHSMGDTTSKSRWRFVRWGLSNGFEIAVQQEYPNGFSKYLFGGRILVKSSFDEA